MGINIFANMKGGHGGYGLVTSEGQFVCVGQIQGVLSALKTWLGRLVHSMLWLRKVFKMDFWGILPADVLILYLPAAKAGPFNKSQLLATTVSKHRKQVDE